MKIPFNKPCIIGKEIEYILEAVSSGKISGDGLFTIKCQETFEKRYGFIRSLLTTSCTDALEMAAILCDIEQGDEVIIPSFTFVSTANAFVLRGAKIVFADSEENTPNISVAAIENLITNRTRAIVAMHYAGIACDMDAILDIAKRHNLYVIEDAAQAIESFYKNKPLGSLGHLSTFSFHETKNIISGEGGMLAINDEQFIKRAEIIREKGTNRSAFFRGDVDKYQWVDIGSSFLPSDIIAAYLFAQLERIDVIQDKRKQIWNMYYEGLRSLQESGFLKLPTIPEYASNNAHMFYIICRSLTERTELIRFMKSSGILAVFHYLSLHKSQFYKERHDGRELKNSDRYTDTILRLPLYYDLSEGEVDVVIKCIRSFPGYCVK
ncbi:MAG: dTDP-4-amino-4,6-dideoxygalactose transaminase [Gammaproteobacteria bacterium]|nr:MAG: dTDP-4-amino-4,6-dideoxygalactose transaminase [Gammaproteobacteria bacterium]